MNVNEDIRNDASVELIELGVASVETKGGPGFNEAVGLGGTIIPGIAEE